MYTGTFGGKRRSTGDYGDNGEIEAKYNTQFKKGCEEWLNIHYYKGSNN